MTTLFKLLTALALFFLALYGINKHLPNLKNYITPKIEEYKAERSNITPEKVAPAQISVEGKG